MSSPTTAPLDPDSDHGRDVARNLTEVLVDIEHRLDRERAAAATGEPQTQPASRVGPPPQQRRGPNNTRHQPTKGTRA